MANVANLPLLSPKAKRLVAKSPQPLMPIIGSSSLPKPKESNRKDDERDTDRMPRIFYGFKDAVGAVMFYKLGFGAEELVRRTKSTNPCPPPFRKMKPNVVAELDFGGYVLVVYQADIPVKPDKNRGYNMLTAVNPDEFIAQAVSAGAVAEGEVVQGVKGRVGRIRDPYGFVWQVSEYEEERCIPHPFCLNKEGITTN